MSGFGTLCDSMAAALAYPGSDYAKRVLCYRDIAAVEAPAAVELAEAFMANIEGKSLSELEEQYIRTFDLNPLCSLDTGWQLFGEEYNRGLYMVKIRGEMRGFDIQESTELPDHLTNVLQVLGRMPEDDAISFAVSCLIPAIDKILRAVKKDNMYRPLIEGIARMLEERYGRYVEEFEAAAKAAETAIAAKGDPPDYLGVFAAKEGSHE